MIAWECQFAGQGDCSHAKCDGIMRIGGEYERPCGCECHEPAQPHRCEACRREISHAGMCADCEREIEHMAEIRRLRAGDGTPDERADWDAAQRMIQSGE